MLKKLKLKSTILLLAFVLILQSGTPAVFAAESEPDNPTKAELTKRISELRTNGLYTDEEPGVYLNARNITVDVDDKTLGDESIRPQPDYQLELMVNGKVQTQNVQWYCYTVYPENLYLPSELQSAFDKNASDPNFNPYDNIAAFVDKNGLVTGKVSKGGVIVFALYNNHIYPCKVTVRDSAVTKINLAKDKAAEIISREKIDKLPTRAEQVLAVHDYLADNVIYNYNYLHADFAYDAIFNHYAVCNGFAKAFQTFMQCLGIPCEYRTGKQGSSAHAWDIVQMDDDKWYYVDVTQNQIIDTYGNVLQISHKKFLTDRATLSKWGYGLSEEMDEGEDGTEFRVYTYKKEGIFAENEADISAIIDFQLASAKETTAKISIVVPDALKAKAEETMNNQHPSLTVNSNYTDLGGYSLAEYDVSGISTANKTNIDFTGLEDSTESGQTTSSLKLSFSKDVPNLNINDIKVSGAEKVSLKYNDDCTYTLTVRNPYVADGGKITVSVAKSGFSFSTSERSVTAHIAALETPAVEAEARDENTVVITGFTNNTEYSLNNGEWTKLPAGSPSVTIEASYPYEFRFINRSDTSGVMDSGMQKIKFEKHSDTLLYDITSEDCTGTSDSGKITGVNISMEYRKSGAQVWTSCVSNVITGLSPGEYDVRLKANKHFLASSPRTLVISSDASNWGTGNGTPDTGDSSGGSGAVVPGSGSDTGSSAGGGGAVVPGGSGGVIPPEENPSEPAPDTGENKDDTTSAVPDAAAEAEKTQKVIKGVKNTKIKVKRKSYKKSIKLYWTKSGNYKIDYYQVFRSVKRSSGYGTKPFYTTKKTTYTNTRKLKKGVTYYYKVRGVRIINGKKVYTAFSAYTYGKRK